MNSYNVSLFGHREINELLLLEKQLLKIVKNLIRSKEYVSFFIGRNGEFDEYAASLIKRAQKEMGKENNEINLVLPYLTSNIEYYEKYYDNIIIPSAVYRAHPKAAITIKNRWMVEQSELVIVYVEHEYGGAYTAMKYAEKINKKVFNIYRNVDLIE